MKNRSRLVCLNKNQLLTHGNPLGFAALVLRLKPSAESFTAVVESAQSVPVMFSQVLHSSGERSARLNFVICQKSGDERDVMEAWDYLCGKAGEMGALNVLAQLEEYDPLFDSLRKAGFNVYGWESSWKLPDKITAQPLEESKWLIAKPTDVTHMRSLYQSLVPPIVQAAENFANGNTRRLLYRENGEILAYVESVDGPAGLILKPLIHPAVKDLSALLTDLAAQFTGIGQTIYLQVRSYQAWLLETLEAIGGESTAQFSLLVKHLAIMQRNGVIINNHKRVEHRHAEPTTPIVNNLVTDDPPVINK